MKNEKASFGAGCFWHIQYEFDKIKGVIKTEVGYMGGDEKKFPNPNYKLICSDKTGYVETVQVTFNPLKISYEKLLDMFWKLHDPTSLNKQGNDIGTQYQSVIFYHNKKQKKIAENSKKEEQKKNKSKIVTKIKKAGTFFPAEEYHQKYLEKSGKASCGI